MFGGFYNNGDLNMSKVKKDSFIIYRCTKLQKEMIFSRAAKLNKTASELERIIWKDYFKKLNKKRR